MQRVNFDSENVEMPALDLQRVEQWLGEVAASHGRSLGRLSYLFCDDPYILRANRDFIGHDYFTDIITFDYSTPERISGDILISLDTVASNAPLVGASYERELLRVIVHGVLHLCGINDKLPGEREVMEANEDAALLLWDKM